MSDEGLTETRPAAWAGVVHVLAGARRGHAAGGLQPPPCPLETLGLTTERTLAADDRKRLITDK